MNDKDYKIYKSKVDLWMVCLILSLLLIIVVPVMIWAFSWIALILTVALIVAIFYLMFSIRYIIEGDDLKIKSGFSSSDIIQIKNITKLTPTKTGVSAPAASMDRIALYLKTQRSPIIISPKNKEEFVNTLKTLNPNIETNIVI